MPATKAKTYWYLLPGIYSRACPRSLAKRVRDYNTHLMASLFLSKHEHRCLALVVAVVVDIVRVYGTRAYMLICTVRNIRV